MGSRPLACDLSVLTDVERQQLSDLQRSLGSAVRGVREIADGYEVTLDSDSGFIGQLERFISFEKRCCPFLVFDVASAEDQTIVRITGPEGTQAFLAAEYGFGIR